MASKRSRKYAVPANSVAKPTAQSADKLGSSFEEGNRSKVTHGATGPRTVSGKKQSSRNARTHGIFCQEVVLEGESRAHYEGLLADFVNYFRPAGAVEDLLVEKLAMLTWRHRRLIVAEGAEIRRGTESVERDKAIEVRREVEEIEQDRQSDRSAALLHAGLNARRVFENFALVNAQPGLIDNIQNPAIIARCVELLAALRDRIKTDGFDEERDLEILETVYGDSCRFRVHMTLLDYYKSWLSTSQLPEEERERGGYGSPSQCTREILREIDREVSRLQEFQESQATIEASLLKLDRLRFNVPESPALERLLRYEVSLDRSFARTLNQLERLQSIRREQPVPPTVKVEIND